jgi:hypothetical protein
LSVRFEEETVFLRFVFEVVGSEERVGFVKSQNTAAEAEELSLEELLLNLRFFAELNICESMVL